MMRALSFCMLVCAWACAAPSIPEGRLGCATDGDCPSGMACGADQLCRSHRSSLLDASDPHDAGSTQTPDSGAFDAHTPEPDAGDSDTGILVPGCEGCSIEGECYDDGALNPDNPCERCNAARSRSAFSDRDGDSCDDGAFCTENDACHGKSCEGTPRDCDDGVECTGEESCDEDADTCALGTVTCPEDRACDPESDSCVSACPDCTIAQTCIAQGATSSLTVCTICDVERSRTAYSDNDGASCGDAATECSGQDTCLGGRCYGNHLDFGEECGSGPTACSAQDTCDGIGACQPRHLDSGTACGVADGCNPLDTCDGSGACIDAGYAPAGTACVADDDPMTPDECDADGDCAATTTYCTQHTCIDVVNTNQSTCASAGATIACPGTADSASCGSTAFCGQDAQYSGPSRTFSCRTAAGASKSCGAAPAAGDTVIDDYTDLMWQRMIATNYGPTCDDSALGCTHAQAKSYCELLDYGGHTDWRLPNLRELLGLLDLETTGSPATQFPGVTFDNYWTSSAEPTYQSWARWISLGNFAATDAMISERFHARCVRGPRFESLEGDPERYFVYGEDEDEQVALDRGTRIVWAMTHAEELSWQQALAYCQGLDWGGFDDWRLPNRNEMVSILNVEPGAYTVTDLPGTEQTAFWSSSTVPGAPEYAWMQTYYNLNDWMEPKDYETNARCVRDYE